MYQAGWSRVRGCCRSVGPGGTVAFVWIMRGDRRECARVRLGYWQSIDAPAQVSKARQEQLDCISATVDRSGLLCRSISMLGWAGLDEAGSSEAGLWRSEGLLGPVEGESLGRANVVGAGHAADGLQLVGVDVHFGLENLVSDMKADNLAEDDRAAHGA